MNDQSRETFKNKNKNNKEKFNTTNNIEIQEIVSPELIDKELFNINKDIENYKGLYSKLKVNHELKIPEETIITNDYIDDEHGEIKESSELYKKYPINIINYPILVKDYEYKYIYIAVFNDGGLYTKNNLTDNNWEGPHRNSYYYTGDIYIPMRNLAISNEGRLLGVGYDGNIYIKDKEDEKSENLYNKNFGDTFKNEWVKYDNGNSGYKFIYLMLLNNDDLQVNTNQVNTNQVFPKQEVYYLGIDNFGTLYKLVYRDNNQIKAQNIFDPKDKENAPIRANNNNKNEKLYKISLDKDSHLLIINQSKELKRSTKTLNTILTVDKVINFESNENEKKINKKNPNIIYDIIQSQDGRLYGVGSINSNITLLKQTNINFLQPFKVIDNNTNKNQTIVIPEKNIVKNKSNYKIKEVLEKKIETLEESYNKEVNEDNQKFKTFCRGQFPNNYIDIDMLNKIDEFQKKIKNLESVKNDLINLEKLDTISPIQYEND